MLFRLQKCEVVKTTNSELSKMCVLVSEYSSLDELFSLWLCKWRWWFLLFYLLSIVCTWLSYFAASVPKCDILKSINSLSGGNVNSLFQALIMSSKHGVSAGFIHSVPRRSFCSRGRERQRGDSWVYKSLKTALKCVDVNSLNAKKSENFFILWECLSVPRTRQTFSVQLLYFPHFVR